MDKIKKTVTELLNDCEVNRENPDMKRDMMEKYYDFSMKYPVLFLSIVNNDFCQERFNEMTNLLSNVENNKISKHDASVKIGTKLVDKYVKPILKKK